MAFDAGGLGLPRAALTLLRDLVHERTGLYYDDQRADSMGDRLAPLVTNRGFESFLDYYYYLKYDDGSTPEWDRVMDALSVAETYFWREIDQVLAVADRIVPALARSLGRPVRIWCVPCASGEEPLTLAMLFHARGRAREVAIHASDASPAALEAARAGLYRERSFRALPPDFRARYFSPEGNRWRVDPEIHAMVASWTQVNLSDSAQVAPMARADVIFCRNVFIYFSEDAIRRVTDCFADHLSDPGYLCLGASESLLRLSERFDLEQVGDALVYVRRPARAERKR